MADLKDALKLLASAEKSIKTGFFKWTADWEVGAESFEQAGRSFRLAKEYARSADAYTQASKAHAQYRAYYHAGRALESAADSLRAGDAKNTKDTQPLLMQASDFFRRDGKHDAAAVVLEKAGKLAEAQNDWTGAAEFYLQVVDVRETEGQLRTLKKVLTKAIQMCIKANQLPRALELLAKEREIVKSVGQENLLHQNALGQMIVHLALDDFVAAERIFQDLLASYVRADENRAGNELLDAFESGEQERLSACTRQQVFSFLDNELALLARKLRIDGVQTQAASKAQVSAASTGRSELFARPAAPASVAADELATPPPPAAAAAVVVVDSRSQLFAKSAPAASAPEPAPAAADQDVVAPAVLPEHTADPPQPVSVGHYYADDDDDDDNEVAVAAVNSQSGDTEQNAPLDALPIGKACNDALPIGGTCNDAVPTANDADAAAPVETHDDTAELTALNDAAAPVKTHDDTAEQTVSAANDAAAADSASPADAAAAASIDAAGSCEAVQATEENLQLVTAVAGTVDDDHDHADAAATPSDAHSPAVPSAPAVLSGADVDHAAPPATSNDVKVDDDAKVDDDDDDDGLL